MLLKKGCFLIFTVRVFLQNFEIYMVFDQVRLEINLNDVIFNACVFCSGAFKVTVAAIHTHPMSGAVTNV